jgi:hypothetical protein
LSDEACLATFTNKNEKLILAGFFGGYDHISKFGLGAGKIEANLGCSAVTAMYKLNK